MSVNKRATFLMNHSLFTTSSRDLTGASLAKKIGDSGTFHISIARSIQRRVQANIAMSQKAADRDTLLLK